MTTRAGGISKNVRVRIYNLRAFVPAAALVRLALSSASIRCWIFSSWASIALSARRELSPEVAGTTAGSPPVALVGIEPGRVVRFVVFGFGTREMALETRGLAHQTDRCQAPCMHCGNVGIW